MFEIHERSSQKGWNYLPNPELDILIHCLSANSPICNRRDLHIIIAGFQTHPPGPLCYPFHQQSRLMTIRTPPVGSPSLTLPCIMRRMVNVTFPSSTRRSSILATAELVSFTFPLMVSTIPDCSATLTEALLNLWPQVNPLLWLHWSSTSSYHSPSHSREGDSVTHSTPVQDTKTPSEMALELQQNNTAGCV